MNVEETLNEAVFNVKQGIIIWDFYFKNNNKTLNLNKIKMRSLAFNYNKLNISNFIKLKY